MPSATFRVCSRCGQETAMPVYTCTRCGHTVREERHRGGTAFTLLVVAIIAAVAFVAWHRFASAPPPFIGAWASQRYSFTFTPDGKLVTDGIFQKTGEIRESTKKVTVDWTSHGSFITLAARPGAGGPYKDPVQIKYELSPSGRDLTLYGLNEFGNYRAVVKLTRR